MNQVMTAIDLDSSLSRADYNERSSARRVLTPIEALFAHPAIALTSALIVGSIVMWFTFPLQSSFLAEGKLIVGTSQFEANAIPGYVAANSSLASSYARIGASRQVLDATADRLEIPVKDLKKSVEVTNIPESPFVRVAATARTQVEAEQRVDLLMDVLIARVRESNSRTGEGERVLEAYRQAVKDAQAAIAAATEFGPLDVAPNDERVLKLQADVDAAQLRVDTLASLYRQTQLPLAEPSPIEKVGPAEALGSTRNGKIGISLGSGAIAGGLAAVLVAWLVSNLRRAPRASVREKQTNAAA